MADRTPVIVAAIGLIGVITAAAIANPRNVRELLSPGSAAAPATPPAAPPDEPIRTASAPPSSDAAGSVAGGWMGDDGMGYIFTQSGSAFAYRQPYAADDEGRGTISGTKLTYAFATPQGPGTCEATLDVAARTIVGTCTRGGESWPVRLRRARPKELHRDI